MQNFVQTDELDTSGSKQMQLFQYSKTIELKTGNLSDNHFWKKKKKSINRVDQFISNLPIVINYNIMA